MDSLLQALADLLIAISTLEDKVNLARRALMPTFAPQKAFNQLDYNRRGYLTSQDFLRFLKSQGVEVAGAAAFAIAKQYSSNQKLQIHYPDFQKLFWHVEVNDDSQNGKHDAMEYLMTRLLQKEIIYQQLVEEARKNLKSTYGYNIPELYFLLEDGSPVGHGALSKFLHGQGIFVSEEDVDHIMRRLDVDGDGFLSYTEFSNSVMPSGRDLGKIDERENSPVKRLQRSQSPDQLQQTLIRVEQDIAARSRSTSPLRRSGQSLNEAVMTNSPTIMNASPTIMHTSPTIMNTTLSVASDLGSSFSSTMHRKTVTPLRQRIQPNSKSIKKSPIDHYVNQFTPTKFITDGNRSQSPFTARFRGSEVSPIIIPSVDPSRIGSAHNTITPSFKSNI